MSRFEGIQDEIRRVSEQLFDAPEALEEIDVVVTMAIVTYVNSRPALGRADRVALRAIAALADHDPAQARVLAVELA